MRVKMGEIFSKPRDVKGGSPQGSILGNFLFCLTSNLLEADSQNTAGGDTERVSHIISEDERTGPESGEEKEAFIAKFIDDYSVIETFSYENEPCHITCSKPEFLVHAKKSQKVFNYVRHRADEIGMKINEEKTQLLCIHKGSFDNVQSYIEINGKNCVSTEKLKILGFVFGQRPSAEAHVQYIEEKISKKIWLVVNLRRAGWDRDQIVKFYSVCIRPIIEYASSIYNSMLTKGCIDRLEAMQKRVLRVIYGYNYTYADLLKKADLETLKERRESRFIKFAQKLENNPRFEHLLLKNSNRRSTRLGNRYEIEATKNEKARRNPIYEIKRLLNAL
jgi:hypothetical protein